MCGLAQAHPNYTDLHYTVLKTPPPFPIIFYDVERSGNDWTYTFHIKVTVYHFNVCYHFRKCSNLLLFIQ